MNSVFYLLLHPNKLLSIPYPANTRWIRQWWSDLNSALKFVQIRLFTTMNAITIWQRNNEPFTIVRVKHLRSAEPYLLSVPSHLRCDHRPGDFSGKFSPARCNLPRSSPLPENSDNLSDRKSRGGWFLCWSFSGIRSHGGNVFPLQRTPRTSVSKYFPIFHRSTGYVCGSLFHNGDVLGSFCSSNRPH